MGSPNSQFRGGHWVKGHHLTLTFLFILTLTLTLARGFPTSTTETIQEERDENNLILLPENLNSQPTLAPSAATTPSTTTIRVERETTIKEEDDLTNVDGVENAISFGVPEIGVISNLSITLIMDSMVEMRWAEPLDKDQRAIEEYRVFYVHDNVTRYRPVVTPRIILNNLVPFTKYKVWVELYRGNGMTDVSEVLTFRTDVGPPQPPLIVNISCQSETAIFLVIKSPTHFNNTIDYFYVDYRKEDQSDFEEKEIAAQMGQKTVMLILQNLTANSVYEIKVRASTRSLIETTKVYKSRFSDSRKVRLGPDCVAPTETTIEEPESSSGSEFTPVMITVTVVSAFIVVLLLLSLLIWRKRCFQGAYYYLDDHLRLPPLGTGIGWEGDASDGFKQVVPIHLFPKHVADLHVDGDIGFSKEYESIQVASGQEEFSSEYSHHPDNKLKNRYLNIVAYDHSLVRLYPLSGSKKLVEYVNANYIDGFQKPRAYIATQGPLPSTFDSFWRIVWEHNVHIIVMITNLLERGRKKCDQYWPKEGIETYGVVQVRLVKEEAMATYTVRVFQLRHLKKKKKQYAAAERTVYHYHYTNWPDHGTPSHPLPVLSFVQKSSLANPPDGGPIIVHCSAGVGRTGTYIVLDAMLRQIRARGDLNVFGYLQFIRTQRNFLVQTEEQYIFIHDALLEAIESGDTNISRNCLTRYINSLLTGTFSDESSEESTLLERQFKLVVKFCPKEFHISAAQKPCNMVKNRNQEYISCDAHRVLLTPRPGIEGSDYINASFLPGFLRLQEFILTQHPLETTTAAFWQMLCDHNVQTLVVLSVVDDGEYRAFWPTATEDLVLDTFRVKLLEESDRVGYVLREFSIESLQDDDELSVKMIQSSHWPHHCASSLRSVFELLQMVEESVNEAHVGPIVVVDKFGGLEGATFCALSALVKQLELESHIDIYMYAKLYHEQRPGVWKTLEDYLFLYRSLEELLTGRRNSEATPVPGSPSPLTATEGDDSLRVLTQPPTELTEVSTTNDRWSPEAGDEDDDDDDEDEEEDSSKNSNENENEKKDLVTLSQDQGEKDLVNLNQDEPKENDLVILTPTPEVKDLVILDSQDDDHQISSIPLTNDEFPVSNGNGEFSQTSPLTNGDEPIINIVGLGLGLNIEKETEAIQQLKSTETAGTEELDPIAAL